ncbi:UDP-4-amino-4,6-dideoxy-N-acetyl-beta-L-altrosamine N-acetyltransferase [Bacteroides sp. OttesenSCG-928-D19]|nr:UDP-4-amino-4,6-dideoxy-N-acetyl-beta-L-altrosamine N-acetyltransferase [Bacteroides sp. OttesenSCG-928-D19]
MRIDKNEIYHYKDYSYKNFVVLSNEELEMILSWRNSSEVRQWMINTKEITLVDHLNYVQSLNSREDVFYWLILRGDNPVGVLNIINVDFTTKTGEPGFYMSPQSLNRGEGILVLQNYKEFLLNVLGFDQLLGHNYVGNLNALQLSLFFGADIDSVIEKGERKYVSLCLKKEKFKYYETRKLIPSFVKFNKENPLSIDQILIDYTKENE